MDEIKNKRIYFRNLICMFNNFRVIPKILLFVLILTIFSFSALAFDVDFYGNDYYYGDTIHFKACGSIIPKKAEISCYNGKLEEKKISVGCKVYAFDSKKLTCSSPKVTFYSSNSVGESHSIPIRNYYSMLIEKLESGTISSNNAPEKLAEMFYGYHVLSADSLKKKQILEVLKGTRDNSDKCWPSSSCSIKDTVDILYYLSLSGIDTETRIYKDALLWVESQQNEISDSDMQMKFYADEDSTCTIYANSASDGSFTFDSDEEYSYNYSYEEGDNLTFVCNDDYSVEIYDEYEEVIFSDHGDSDDNVTFTYYAGCLPRVTDHKCSEYTTSKYLMLNSITSSVKSSAKSWLTDKLSELKIAAKKLETTNSIEKNLYAYAVTSNSDLKTWILYTQNNDGSFGSEDILHSTMVAINTFSGQDNEWIDDAIDWVLTERTEEPNSSIYDTAALYQFYKSKKPVLISSPLLPYSESGQISYTLSSNILLSGISINLDSSYPKSKHTSIIDKPSKIKSTKITLKNTLPKDGYYYGAIDIKDGFLNRSIPYLFRKKAIFAPKFPKTYYLYNSTGNITIPISYSESIKKCDFRFNDIFLNKSFVPNASEVIINYNIFDKYPNNSVSRIKVNAYYNCFGTYDKITEESKIKIIYVPKNPFTYNITVPELSEKPFEVVIKNNLNDTYNIALSLEDPLPYYNISNNTLKMTPSFKPAIKVCQAISSNDTLNTNNVLYLSSLGRKTSISFNSTLNSVIHKDCNTETKTDEKDNFLLFMVFGIIGLVIISALISMYYLFIFKKVKSTAEAQGLPELLENEEKNKSTENNKPHKKYHRKKVIRSSPMAEVLVALDEKMGEKKDDIEKDLKHEGYVKKERKQAFKGLEEIEKHLTEKQNKMKDDSEENNKDSDNKDNKTENGDKEKN